jgi:hypothetical protein
MKNLLFLLILLLTSCVNLQNICLDSPEGVKRFSGEILKENKTSRFERTITLKQNNVIVKIYKVPNEQPSVNIPACKHRNGKYYWVMP